MKSTKNILKYKRSVFKSCSLLPLAPFSSFSVLPKVNFSFVDLTLILTPSEFLVQTGWVGNSIHNTPHFLLGFPVFIQSFDSIQCHSLFDSFTQNEWVACSAFNLCNRCLLPVMLMSGWCVCCNRGERNGKLGTWYLFIRKLHSNNIRVPQPSILLLHKPIGFADPLPSHHLISFLLLLRILFPALSLHRFKPFPLLIQSAYWSKHCN